MKAILLAIVLACTGAAAQTPDPAALVGGLAGRWTGVLAYRDYQSDKREELPMVSDIVALPDGATIIAINRFDDGPKAGIVGITDVSLFDPARPSVTSMAFRRGKPIEPETNAVSVSRFTDPTHWSIVYTQDGTDNDKPALLRVTQTRDGGNLASVKEVQPRGADTVWQFRSETRLKRDTLAAVPDRAK